jgi:RHS repeat-associated protein
MHSHEKPLLVNRYYSNAYGRFMTPDPYQGNGGGPGDPNNPQSWNRYAYTVGDPVNWNDPDGEFYQPPQQPPNQPLPPIVNSNQGGSPNPGGTTKNHNGAPPNPILTAAQVVSTAEQLALQWLNNSSCAALFGNGLGNPETVLQSLVTTGSFSSGFHEITLGITQAPGVGLDALTIPQVNLLAQGLFGAGLGTYLGMGAAITINESATGAYDPSGVVPEFAEAVIEELGHAYNYTPGSGGSSIQYDNPLFSSGTNNTSLINTSCDK